jgi:tRNA pseudouridine55 synthase
VTLWDVQAAARRLVGPIDQVPPMVSAVKVGGERLHTLARRGVEVERPARSVVVHRFEAGPTDSAGVFRIEVECSSGTYIRVLGADLGRALGGGAHIRNLRRRAIGSFSAHDATPLEGLTTEAVLSPARALRDYPSVPARPDVAPFVRHGRVLDRAELGVSGSGPWAVLDAGGDLLAVYEEHGGGRVKPAVVLAPR